MANFLSLTARAAARLALKAVPDGTGLPILRGPARGCTWYAGAAPGPSRGLSVIWNLSEPEQLGAAAALAEGAECCFDIGAHTGLYSLVFARRARRVCAFEPWPRNIGWLHRTLERNGAGNVTIVPWAVSRETGELSFREGAHNSMGRIDESGTFPVFAVSLRDFIARRGHRPDVLKIDTEGAETDVLRGGLEYLRERRPALLLSVHGAQRRAECLELLRGLGYARIKPLNARNLELADEYRVEA
jgi:FkbM family methyltransferase